MNIKQQSKRNKLLVYGVSFVLFALYLFHFVFSLFFTLPQNLVPQKAKSISFSYIYPLFNQGWALFAPPPTYNKEVWIKYQQNNKQWSNWVQPFKENLNLYHSNRLSGNFLIVLTESSTLHYLLEENKLKTQNKKALVGDTSSVYFKSLRFCLKKHLLNRNVEFNDLKIKVLFYSTEKNNPSFSLNYPVIK